MIPLLFDAKCKRCNSINEVNFIDCINNGEDCSREIADTYIFKFTDWVLDCPKCGIKTIHELVTLIKD